MDSAELGHSLKRFGSSARHAEPSPESFGIVVCRSVGTVPGFWGSVWPSFRLKSVSKSRTPGWSLKGFQGPFSSGIYIYNLNFGPARSWVEKAHELLAWCLWKLSGLTVPPPSAGNLPDGSLCYTILLPSRKSVLRAGFRPDSSWESVKVGPPAGLRPAGGPI